MLARTVPVLLIVIAASLAGCAHRQQREPEPAALARLKIMAPAILSLRANTYPAGGPYDRAYWTIKARCDAAAQSRGREPLWESTLHPYWEPVRFRKARSGAARRPATMWPRFA